MAWLILVIGIALVFLLAMVSPSPKRREPTVGDAMERAIVFAMPTAEEE